MSYQCAFKKIKIGEFFCKYFNLEDGRRKATFTAHYALLLQERLKMQLKWPKKKQKQNKKPQFVQCMKNCCD